MLWKCVTQNGYRCSSHLIPAGGDVLDLGCGCGLPGTRLLAARYCVTGVDISPVQIERARSLVPAARFHCADITAFPLAPASYHAIVSVLRDHPRVPVAEQRELIGRAEDSLRPGGSAMLMTAGHQPWTGTEENWLGVPGISMYWSHGGEEDYCRWIIEAGLEIRRCEFVPEGGGGHSLVLAVKDWTRRGRGYPKPAQSVPPGLSLKN